MEMNEKLVQANTQAVLAQLQKQSSGDSREVSLAGKTRMRPKHSYEGYPQAEQGQIQGNCDRCGSSVSGGDYQDDLRYSSGGGAEKPESRD